MNWFEMADFLSSRGYHSVFKKNGVDVEALLLGYNYRPINAEEVKKYAEKEGYIFVEEKGLWISSNLMKAS